MLYCSKNSGTIDFRKFLFMRIIQVSTQSGDMTLKRSIRNDSRAFGSTQYFYWYMLRMYDYMLVIVGNPITERNSLKL